MQMEHLSFSIQAQTLPLSIIARYWPCNEWKCLSYTLLPTRILATTSGMQIPCRGRGQAPQPDAVNEFCWSITAFNQHCQREEKGLWTVVHCTHGFNRTGNTFTLHCHTCFQPTDYSQSILHLFSDIVRCCSGIIAAATMLARRSHTRMI